MENPRRGGGSPGFLGPGREGPGGCLLGMWGGGLNIFLGGRNSHQENEQHTAKTPVSKTCTDQATLQG